MFTNMLPSAFAGADDSEADEPEARQKELDLLGDIRPDTPDPDAPEDMPEPDAHECSGFEAGDEEMAAADTAAGNAATVDQDGWQTFELEDLYGNDEHADEPEQEFEQEYEQEYEPEQQPEPEYYDDGRFTARAKGKGRVAPSHSHR
jgi:hypothetical protein